MSQKNEHQKNEHHATESMNGKPANIQWVIGLCEQTIEDDIKQLPPRERIRLWETLQEYVHSKAPKKEIPESSPEPHHLTITRHIIHHGNEA